MIKKTRIFFKEHTKKFALHDGTKMNTDGKQMFFLGRREVFKQLFIWVDSFMADYSY